MYLFSLQEIRVRQYYSDTDETYTKMECSCQEDVNGDERYEFHHIRLPDPLVGTAGVR